MVQDTSPLKRRDQSSEEEGLSLFAAPELKHRKNDCRGNCQWETRVVV